MSRKNVKVCFAASSGGHYEQLMMLRPLFEKYDSFIVTEQTKYKTTQGGERVYRLFQVNRREKKCIFLMLLNLALSVAIFLRERPDFVITTGVLAVIPMCILAKVFRRK
ncbi:MAG: polysaccharide biosynthesis protein, partial [Eubacteriales bacterium]|nr:polysaccharide biosynthesis protein [Eubacteriales bacterium]